MKGSESVINHLRQVFILIASSASVEIDKFRLLVSL